MYILSGENLAGVYSTTRRLRDQNTTQGDNQQIRHNLYFSLILSVTSPHSSPQSSFLLPWFSRPGQDFSCRRNFIWLCAQSTYVRTLWLYGLVRFTNHPMGHMHGLLWRHEVKDKKTYNLVPLLEDMLKRYVLFLQYYLEQKKQRILHTIRRKN
jgi:hypothetical protein